MKMWLLAALVTTVGLGAIPAAGEAGSPSPGLAAEDTRGLSSEGLGEEASSSAGECLDCPKLTKPFEGELVELEPDSSLLLEGTAIPGSLVIAYNNGAELCRATADSSGKWTVKCSTDSDDFNSQTGQYVLVGLTSKKDEVIKSSEKIVKFWVDKFTPIVTMKVAPAEFTSDDNAIFQFSSTEADVTFDCHIDKEEIKPCSSRCGTDTCQRYWGLNEGKHVFTVQAHDQVNTGKAIYTWNVDKTEPVLSLTTKPKLITNSQDAEFSIQANEALGKVECRIDTGAYKPCLVVQTYHDLTVKTHIFYVQAADKAGNPAVLTYSWTIDKNPPETSIVEHPDEVTNTGRADFEFKSSKPNSTFRCSLDGGVYGICKNPLTYPSLDSGPHELFVAAIDEAGNEDPTPASWKWTVDLQAPETRLKSVPEKLSASNEAHFEFDAVGETAAYECKLDDSEFTACTARGDSLGHKTYKGLSEGIHIFQVRAVDSVENKDKTPAQYEWTVDTTPPIVGISAPKAGATVLTSFPLVVGTTEAGSKIYVHFDGEVSTADEAAIADKDGAWALKTHIELSDGIHFVNAMAVDQVGHQGLKTAPVWFTVNTVKPEIQIDEKPEEVSRSSTATFIFSSPHLPADATVTFECQLDEAAEFTPCGQTHAFTKLKSRKHTLKVRAVNEVGGRSLSPAIWEWIVKFDPPGKPNVHEPADGAVVDTGSLVISGEATPKGSVTVFVNGTASGIALVDEQGLWTFRPSSPLSPGDYTLSGLAKDDVGNESEGNSPETRFTVVSSRGESNAIGGGLSCSASNPEHDPSSVIFWGTLVFSLTLYRRRS